MGRSGRGGARDAGPAAGRLGRVEPARPESRRRLPPRRAAEVPRRRPHCGSASAAAPSIPISPGPCGWPGSRTGGPRTAIHDHLYAVAAVIDDGEHRVGIVALDAIGFFHDEVLAVRREVGAGGAARLHDRRRRRTITPRPTSWASGDRATIGPASTPPTGDRWWTRRRRPCVTPWPHWRRPRCRSSRSRSIPPGSSPIRAIRRCSTRRCG